MTRTVLFAASDANWAEYRDVLPAAIADAGVKARVVTEAAPEDVDYIVYAPTGGMTDFAPFTNTRAVLSLWAGVERIAGLPSLTQPLCRMVDAGLSEGMTEWVTGHVLRHHLGMDAHIHGLKGEWRQDLPPLARHRRVGLLGLGALGRAAAEALVQLKFDLWGWSRSPRAVPGVHCVSGDAGLQAVLERSEIVVTLLPATPETQSLLNAQRLAQMPRGAVIINPGRGTLIDDDALLAALDNGQIGHATLDVFRTEPLPADHPYWDHPKVTVTPHIAADTRAGTASEVIAENIRRSEAGEPLLHLVDKTRGY
ncbi:hydroxyacid dehydrogenase [Actibacterium mucosum KCTC 23349]|uniref:Hydroxyacid dehydrogenase n=1 Tax=Actibacterium mucosum KCTC 23349 TaxID=1454373 RepID=A0A037ZIY1_9RHOB|nr:glyoxylate/hydroxypyruvate reductase A [Actibacterium mucosum]KAJ56375.1 hydroxyacid dehydrogenase [Actibacterium mucosum KCTC 23349]